MGVSGQIKKEGIRKWKSLRIAHLQRSERLTALRVPQLHRLLTVLAARGYQRLGGVPVDALHVGAMAPQDALLVAPHKVPDADGAVVGAGGELAVRRAEAMWGGKIERSLSSGGWFDLGDGCCCFALLCFDPILNGPVLLAF